MADLDTLKADAVRALGDVLRNAGAKPADRLRAAEAILRAERDGLAAVGELNELSDQALLLIAHEGGTPPKRGPAGTSAETVPSHAGKVPPSSLGSGVTGAGVTGAGSNIPLLSPGAGAEPPGIVRPANPFMQRGPKEDPGLRVPGGIPLEMGPKEDPDPWT
jgi:hypothetical protein